MCDMSVGMRAALLPCVWCARGHEGVRESVAIRGLPAGDDSLPPLFFFLIKCMSPWLDWNSHVDHLSGRYATMLGSSPTLGSRNQTQSQSCGNVTFAGRTISPSSPFSPRLGIKSRAPHAGQACRTRAVSVNLRLSSLHNWILSIQN